MLSQYPLFDSHMHIIDKRFPLTSNNGFLPTEFTCSNYLERMSSYQLCGGVIVSGSFQAFDQAYLIDALATLGPSFVGVTQLPASVTDEEIYQLNERGVRAIRFNLKRGGSEDISQLASMAQRVYEIARWHVELYVDSTALEELFPILQTLPLASIDHLGLSSAGFDNVLRLAEKGFRVKATGFSRVDFAVPEAITKIYKVNSQALMFGSDLPSTRAPCAYSDNDFVMVSEVLGDSAAKRVFSENAIEFYHPELLKNG